MVQMNILSNHSFQLHGFSDSLLEISEAQRLDTVSATIQRYYLWVLAGVGIPANILAIIGVLSLGRVIPPSLLVLYLSATDAITLFLKLLVNQISLHDVHMGRIGCRLEFVVISLSTFANWILVGIAVNRFRWIKRLRMLRQRVRHGVDVTRDGQGKGQDSSSLNGEHANKKSRVVEGGGPGSGNGLCYGVLWIKDNFGSVIFTNKGIHLLVEAGGLLLFAGYAIVFFIMRDATADGRRCATYQRYVWFWQHVWYWINTGLFFFLPFTVILILTGITVCWLLLDKREASSGAQRDRADKEESKEHGGGEEGQDTEEQKPTGDSLEATPETVGDDGKPVGDGDQDANGKEVIEELVSSADSRAASEDITDTKVSRTLTAMMVLAAAFFLFTSLPGCIFYLSYKATPSNPVLRSRWRLFEQVVFILVDMSHAMNFFIYFLAVKTFRNSLMRLIACKGRGKFSPDK